MINIFGDSSDQIWSRDCFELGGKRKAYFKRVLVSNSISSEIPVEGIMCMLGLFPSPSSKFWAPVATVQLLQGATAWRSHLGK